MSKKVVVWNAGLELPAPELRIRSSNPATDEFTMNEPGPEARNWPIVESPFAASTPKSSASKSLR